MMVLGWIVCSVVSLSLQSNGIGGSFQTEFFQTAPVPTSTINDNDNTDNDNNG